MGDGRLGRYGCITIWSLLFVGLVFPSVVRTQEASVTSAEPEVLEARVRTPWGTLRERRQYYLEDGEEIGHGVLERYGDDGQLECRLQSVDGEPHGVQAFYYEGIATKREEMRYLNGAQHGRWVVWTPEGEVLFEGEYRDDEPWDGWFWQGSSSSSGSEDHLREESWTIRQWNQGAEVPRSEKEVSVQWQDWKPGTLPDFDRFTFWRWSEFDDPKAYPYLATLPPYDQVPFLIERIAEKGEHYDYAHDQLAALTRVDFVDPFLADEEELAGGAEKWREWWREVGRHRPTLRADRGVRDAAAWDLVQRDRGLPVPETPIVIPETYLLMVSFRSGDYGGVIRETITIRRTRRGASLERSYATQTDAPLRFERWLPFEAAEADRVVRALGYLVDRPWLLNDETDIERRHWAEDEGKGGRWLNLIQGGPGLVGRESYRSLYYPSASYELRDEDGKLWWNAERHSWSGGNPDRFNHVDQPVASLVYPFLAARYPETQRREDASQRGWVQR